MRRAALFICRETRLSANGGRARRLVQRRGERAIAPVPGGGQGVIAGSDGRVQDAVAHEFLSLSLAPEGTAWPRCSGVSESSASKIPSHRDLPDR